MVELNGKMNMKIWRMNTAKEPDIVCFKLNLHDFSADEKEYYYKPSYHEIKYSRFKEGSFRIQFCHFKLPYIFSLNVIFLNLIIQWLACLLPIR